MALTDAQMTDTRRYLGYPLNGTTFVVTDDQDTVYMQFGMVIMSLYTRLTNMSDTEEAVLTGTYLTNLNSLESAIVTASSNLDTDEAAVWVHNKSEVADRSGLFDSWRRRLCGFIGIEPGPDLGASGGVRIVRG